MATIEVLFALQDELLDSLKRAEKNYKKTPKERIRQQYIETRLEGLEQLFKEFKEGHKAIISKTPKDKKYPYFSEDKFESFEEQYVQYKTSLREALQPLKIGTAVQVSGSGSGNDTAYSEGMLPRINLPSFSGKYEEWQPFHDMFTSLIRNNKNISPVQKLQYLKGNLSGEAHDLLRNLSTIESNYEEAWNQLIRRYDNKRFNCNTVLRNLFAIKKIHSESATAVRKLLDTTSSCLKSLQSMGISTDTWDAIIVFLVVSKLDTESVRLWEQQLNKSNEEFPTWLQLRDYLEYRFKSIEMLDSTARAPLVTQQVTKTKAFHSSIENKSKGIEVECAMCHENHYVYNCKQFGLMTPKDRQVFVQKQRLCFNCLSPTHAALKCRHSLSCRKCGRRHHTLLHFTRENNGSEQENNLASELAASSSSGDPRSRTSISRGNPHITAAFSRGELQPNSVLLATAKVKVCNSIGCKQTIRALLDQGSQASFVTEATVQLLGLKRKPVCGWVSGLGDGRMRIKYMVSVCIESCYNPNNVVQVNAYVLKSLTALLPGTKLSVPVWSDIANLPLADQTYSTPGKIDILLGAEVYSVILLEGIIKRAEGNFMAQNTIFGWILSGRLSYATERTVTANFKSMHVRINEDDLLKKFWEIENETNTLQKPLTKSEELCEDLFNKTTVRDDEGRLVVKLPFTTDNPMCQYGNSRAIAIKRLELLERKLMREPQLRQEYNHVFEEYLRLNHMRECNESELQNLNAVYLPHHAVVREDKQTTKVRVVFDASCKGENNIALNDELLIGPKLQQDLRHILMRWRNHRVCLVSDIVKMYRMVRVADENTDFQRVVWRFNADEPLQHYKLLRLTFGTACAPYLAVKALQRLAELEEEKYPLAAKITKHDFYMDDLITGADTERDVLQIYNEMTELMKCGGFELQKWSSNCKTVSEEIGNSHEQGNQSDLIKFNTSIKVLGVNWNRATDNFEYMLNLPKYDECVTKRQVLGVVARLYDPLGWIAPVVIIAKIFIQKLWKSGLEWDDHLKEDLLQQWLTYRCQLTDLKQLHIPRWMSVTRESKIELHVFSDASRAAYAAAVYMRVRDNLNQFHVHLVTAKTKVAPVEKEISIPRLELCGAALGAKLVQEVSLVMGIAKENIRAWTDSTIVLAWLKGGSSRWTTFVSNRVSTILNILDYEQWNHVPTESNPADCATRGLHPKELVLHTMWWNGPQWLAQADIETSNILIGDTREEERIQSLNIVSDVKEECLWDRFSSLTRLLKVISYCRRFFKLKINKKDRLVLPKFITTDELNKTLLTCINEVQKSEFNIEIKQLNSRGCVPKKSSLRSLCPFVDDKGTLRVSGRITQSEADYDTRYPMILPHKNNFTRLVMIDAHHKTLHGGPQIMLNYLRTKYWILKGREGVKKVYRECVTCIRYSNKKCTPVMGLLPEARLKPCKPFKSSGADFAGPISIRFSSGRGAKAYKGYICLFVCMVTRAVHLEAVSDLSTKGFLAAFRRFTGRRGHCQDLYTDNGTNFVGADRELRDMFNRAKSTFPEEIASLLTLERTTWHFIPPHAPNFGGLWEAGIRSTKTHLRKVVGNSTLTFEELATVLTQVEACLNSRPITLLSDDPNDPLPLTPGHFLIGEPLLNLADEDYTKCNVLGLDRWRLTQKIVTDFWNRWYKEYLVSLNQRYKWNTNSTELEIGDIVLLKEDNIPPAKWILGKIIQKHTGPDNVTRVVSVKIKTGILKRPVNKLCLITK